MQLIQIFLPLKDNAKQAFPAALFAEVKKELVQQFGGLTAFLQAPAQGLWAEDGSHVAKDDIVIFEVMADALDRGWWKAYRAQLEARFSQDKIIIRASAIEML